jgi:hypothetical protein
VKSLISAIALASGSSARFDRVFLALPGVTHVVLLEGLHDIGFGGAEPNGRYLADPGDIRTAGPRPNWTQSLGSWRPERRRRRFQARVNYSLSRSSRELTRDDTWSYASFPRSN